MTRLIAFPAYGCLLLRFRRRVHGYHRLLAIQEPILRFVNRLVTKRLITDY